MSSSARIPHPIVACRMVCLERTLAFDAIFRCHNFTKECPADSRRLSARFLPDARRFRTTPLILARIPARTGNRRHPGVCIIREEKYLKRKRCGIVTTLWNEWREVTSAQKANHCAAGSVNTDQRNHYSPLMYDFKSSPINWLYISRGRQVFTIKVFAPGRHLKCSSSSESFNRR